jgi:hypothetical protein
LTSHCAAGLALLIAQYQDSPRLQALICSYLDQVQAAETGTVAVYERGLDLDTAVGAQLDIIGRLVRESRDGRADLEYRRALAVRVLVNRSQGRHEDLIAIVRLFEALDDEPGAVVRVQSVQPAAVEVRLDSTPVNGPRAVDKRLRRAKAAGVRLTTIGGAIDGYTPATAFRLVTPVEAESKSAVGLAPIGLGFGGYLAHALG